VPVQQVWPDPQEVLPQQVWEELTQNAAVPVPGQQVWPLLQAGLQVVEVAVFVF